MDQTETHLEVKVVGERFEFGPLAHVHLRALFSGARQKMATSRTDVGVLNYFNKSQFTAAKYDGMRGMGQSLTNCENSKINMSF